MVFGSSLAGAGGGASISYEYGYAVSTVFEGDKVEASSPLIPFAALPLPGGEEVLLLDSSNSGFYTLSLPISQGRAKCFFFFFGKVLIFVFFLLFFVKWFDVCNYRWFNQKHCLFTRSASCKNKFLILARRQAVGILCIRICTYSSC